MQFDSFTFLVFFVVVVTLARLCQGWQRRKQLLLFASYGFYAGWSPAFALLLIASSVLDWLIANRIARAQVQRDRRVWLTLSLAANLGLLAAFKYLAFFHQSTSALLEWLGAPPLAPLEWSIVLPVGISFYTFQSLSYTIDVFRRRIEPVRSLADYCLFVAFFPQLVAGPIVRATDFMPQLAEPRRPQWDSIGLGAAVMLLGLFEKIVLADSVFAPVVDAAWANPAGNDLASSGIGALAFSGQIFCDFAGYSLCAIGAAHCLGFHLPANFHCPYAAFGFRDFWRRWHISLSTWLRDYLYISLGGSRHGALRTSGALLATMALGGLWHGAGWNFVLWGVAHGVLLVLERAAEALLRLRFDALRGPLAWLVALITLAAVTLLWVPFRAPDLSSAVDFVGALGRPGAGLGFDQQLAAIAFVLLVLVHCVLRDTPLVRVFARLPAPALALSMALLLIGIVLSPGDNYAFIYFQF